MSLLTPREQALVSIGAAMGSNCSSCIEHHVPASRKAGLGDAHISEAIRLADKVRQVPARKTLDTAFGLLAQSTSAAPVEKPCCG
jgi:4-carboxymuconolactone decarboxylase